LKNIYVGNLDPGSDEQSIRLLFEEHGAVHRVKVMLDPITGQSRGFAFVEMPEHGAATRAITALNGANLGARALNIREARQKVHQRAAGHQDSTLQL
jgi:RNA recognition motif-containing protein